MKVRSILIITLFLISHSFAGFSNIKIDSMTTDQTGSLSGQVFDHNSGQPLAGVNITIKGTRRGAISDQQGNFNIQAVQPDSYTVIFEYIGYKKQYFDNIVVQLGKNTELSAVELNEEPFRLNEIVVTPGAYAIMGSEPSISQTLTSDDIKMMGWAEDITRAVQRIPGISSNDFSAKFNVRGGKANEVLVLLDGMQIYQPFHQKDFGGGIFSTIDIETIDNVNLLTGGFTADYGDRNSAVLNMNTKTAKDNQQKITLGLSLINAQAFSMGTFDENRGKYLISARRGFLDLLNKLMKNEFKLVPSYYDILGKIDYKLSDNHTISIHGFIANDAYKLDEKEKEPGKALPNIDFVETEYGNGYGWFTLKSLFSKELYARSVLYGGSVTKSRYWDRYDDDPNFHLTMAELNDDRDFTLLGAKQDWNWQTTDNFSIKFGADIKQLDVSFKYSNNIYYEYISARDSLEIRDDSLKANRSESGNQVGLYLATRFQLLDPLVIETGIRFDHTSYTSDNLWSPRINLVYALSKRTSLRAGWGYYYQSQQIDELQIQYKRNAYHSAELSKQYVLGLEHFFLNGMHLRAEAYIKNNSNVADAYYTFANIDEFFPEARDDLFQVSFDKAHSTGLELYLKYDTGDKFSWWISYVYSQANEYYKDIQYPGKISKELGKQARPWDQKHTINADVNYRLNKNWHFNLSWQYHSGWPYTPFTVERKQRRDGTFAYYHDFKTFNSARFPDYHRLDARINRYFYPSDSKITLYLQIINLYNQENISAYDHNIKNETADGYDVVIEKETWFELTPFLGITWEF